MRQMVGVRLAAAMIASASHFPPLGQTPLTTPVSCPAPLSAGLLASCVVLVSGGSLASTPDASFATDASSPEEPESRPPELDPEPPPELDPLELPLPESCPRSTPASPRPCSPSSPGTSPPLAQA